MFQFVYSLGTVQKDFGDQYSPFYLVLVKSLPIISPLLLGPHV